MPTQENITVRDVTSNCSDINFLYQILKERSIREPLFRLPSYIEHCNYIESKPYLSFKLLSYKDLLLGCAFLSRKFEIGAYLTKFDNIKNNIKPIKGIDLSSTMMYACVEDNNFPSFVAFSLHENYRGNRCILKLSKFRDMEEKYCIQSKKDSKYNVYQFKKN